MAEGRHRKITLPISAYISGTLKYATNEDAIVLESSSFRFMQWIVSAKTFYKAAHGSFDTVLIIKRNLNTSPCSNKNVVLLVCKSFSIFFYYKSVLRLNYSAIANISERIANVAPTIQTANSVLFDGMRTIAIKSTQLIVLTKF